MMKYLNIAGILILIGAVYAYYLYNKPVASTNDLDAAFSINADELFAKFENNEEEANQLYLGKILEVKGKVRDLSVGDNGELNMILESSSDMFGINCGISLGEGSTLESFKPGDSVTVKGECTGISMDVVLTRCVIVK